MNRAASVALGMAGALLIGLSMVVAADTGPREMKYRAVAPLVARAAEPTQTPTPPPPTPTPYAGPVASLYLASGGVTQAAPVEVRDVEPGPKGPTFQLPTQPGRIAWYSNFGLPGWRGNNSIFAAHINYVGYGNGPFARLAQTAVDDALYVTMANGEVYTYTVKAVQVVHLSALNMNSVVFPELDGNVERVTLISCGGTFVPLPGGGVYDSRVIVVAERYVA